MTNNHPRIKQHPVPYAADEGIRVCFASAGRFHAFDVGRQLHRLGHLRRFYTGYPKWKVDGLPRDRLASFPWLVAPVSLLKQHGLDRVARRLDWAAAASFDRWVATRLEQCDVFHFLSSFGLQAQRVARRRYGALSVCDHGSTHILHQDEILAKEYDRWKIPYRPPLARRLIERGLREYNEADFILVPSSVVYRSFVDRGTPANKLRKVPYGVDLDLFRPVPKEDDVFRVIYVGILNLRKGIPYLLEALAPLRLPKFQVWLVGLVDDEVRSFLHRYEGSYQTFGYVPRNQLYRYYSQASVFVIASIEEGLATVQAQAMACGLPVVATTHTGAEDLFTDGIEGYIVATQDPEAIRERVLRLYRHPELREAMARAALRRVQELRGWGAYGETVVNHYRQAIAGRGGKAR